MLERINEPTNRELKRRALRWQKHRIPRKSPMPFWQRLTAWMMLILVVSLAMVLAGQNSTM